MLSNGGKKKGKHQKTIKSISMREGISGMSKCNNMETYEKNNV